MRVGALADAKAAFSWLMHTIRRHRPWIRPCYTLDGELVPDEREIDIAGYRDTRPVRVGNTANDQLQLCLYGDVFEMTARFVDAGHILDPETARQLFDLGNECADAWMRKDAGFWELEQDEHCWPESKQAYTFYAGTGDLDASLMLASRFGLAEVRHARMVSTRDAIRRELGCDELLYRYSGMQQREGTFTACAFWMVEAYGLLGERDEAKRLFERLLERLGNDVDLMPEMVDAHTGDALGNLPQGLSHLALIHAALAVHGE